MKRVYNTLVKSKQELTTDLMFMEIMELRKEAAELSSLLIELSHEVLNTEVGGKVHQYMHKKAEKALSYLKEE